MDLFALTPRGGRRNHVYLVPDNTEGTRPNVQARANQVQHTVESAKQSPTIADDSDFMVAWRRVRQPDTGREGYEWLCLAGIDARTLPQARRKALENWLEARLGDLDAIVAGHDWDRNEGLFEVIPELADWQRKAQSEFAGFQATGPRASSPLGLPRGGRRSWRRWLAALLTFLMIAACAALWPRCPKLPRRLPPPHSTPRNGDSGIVSDISDKQWRDFAEALLGPETLPGAPGKLKPHLAEQLRKLYDSDAQVEALPKDGMSEDTIGKILQGFEKDVHRRGAEPLAQLIKSGPPQDLKRLFPGGKFDRMGLVDWPDKKFWDMEPYSANDLLTAVTNAKNAWSVPHETRRDYGGERLKGWLRLFDKLRDFCGNPPKRLEFGVEMRRRFYIREDEQTLSKLKELLQDLARAEAISSRDANTGTVTECVRVLVAAVGPNGNKRKELEDLRNTYNPSGPAQPIVHATENLLKLGEEWSKVLQRRVSATQSGARPAPDG